MFFFLRKIGVSGRNQQSTVLIIPPAKEGNKMVLHVSAFGRRVDAMSNGSLRTEIVGFWSIEGRLSANRGIRLKNK